MKKQFLFYALSCIFFVINAQQSFAQLASGKLIYYEQFSSVYLEPRNVDVWLPDGYTTQKKYAVLYMHDGQMLFDSTTTWNHKEWGVDETLGQLMQQHKIKNCIVVAVYNSGKNRHADYFPQKPFEALPAAYRDSLLTQAKRNKATALFGTAVQSDNYLRFLVKELKPFIDSTFSTLPNQSNTFIAGSSMGGLISMYAICEYPEIFGGAACLSTHWPGIFSTENNPIPNAFLHYLQQHLPSPKTHKIYFDYGSTTLDSMYKPYQQKADIIMKAGGYTSKNWITREFAGENHSETAWAKRLYIPIGFILGNTSAK